MVQLFVNSGAFGMHHNFGPDVLFTCSCWSNTLRLWWEVWFSLCLESRWAVGSWLKMSFCVVLGMRTWFPSRMIPSSTDSWSLTCQYSWISIESSLTFFGQPCSIISRRWLSGGSWSTHSRNSCTLLGENFRKSTLTSKSISCAYLGLGSLERLSARWLSVLQTYKMLKL